MERSRDPWLIKDLQNSFFKARTKQRARLVQITQNLNNEIGFEVEASI